MLFCGWGRCMSAWWRWVLAYWVFVSEWHVIASLDLYAAVCYVGARIARPAEVSTRQWQMYPKYCNKPYIYKRFMQGRPKNYFGPVNANGILAWIYLQGKQRKDVLPILVVDLSVRLADHHRSHLGLPCGSKCLETRRGDGLNKKPYVRQAEKLESRHYVIVKLLLLILLFLFYTPLSISQAKKTSVMISPIMCTCMYECIQFINV